MAVYTSLSPSDVQLICQCYGLSQPKSITPIAQGMENSNYFFHFADGQDVVVTLFEEISFEQAAFFCQFLQQLPSAGIPVAAPINTLSGESWITLYHKPLIICPKIAGKHLETPNRSQCQAVGHALAKFHNFTEANPQAFTGVRAIQWLENLAQSSLSLLSANDQVHVKTAMQQFEQVKNLATLRKGLCHCDLFRDNSLFVGDDLTAILDFYSASEHFYLFDLAVLINDWAHNQGINLAKQQAIVEAYQNLRPLSKKEQQYLPLFLRIAAMRFWLSRLLEGQKAKRSAGSIKPFEPCRQLFFDLVSD